MEKSYSSIQQKSINSFIEQTQASEKQAVSVLTKQGWRVDRAVNYWYDYGMTPDVPKVTAECIKIFDKYKSTDEDGSYIYENTAQFLQDCGIDPEDLLSFYIMKILGSKEDFTFYQEEFTQSLAKLRIKSINDIKNNVPTYRKEMKEQYKEFYKWVGRYTCGAIKDTKRKFIPGINKDTEAPITGVLKLLLDKNNLPVPCQFSEKLVEFIDKQIEENNTFQISLDSWDMMYEFICEMKGDIKNYDEYAAWPALIDDFMEFYNKQNEDDE